MATTLTTFHDRVFAALRDSERAFITETQVTVFVNEAIIDLAARFGLLRKEATGTTDSDGTIALPSDFQEMEWLSITDANGDQVMVEWADDQVFNSWKFLASTPTNTLARIYNGDIETYPAAESLAYTMRYEYQPTALSADSDETPLPPELDIKIVNYCRAHCKWIEGEVSEGDRYFQLYSEGLPGAPNAARRERPGPINITPEANWADL